MPGARARRRAKRVHGHGSMRKARHNMRQYGKGRKSRRKFDNRRRARHRGY